MRLKNFALSLCLLAILFSACAGPAVSPPVPATTTPGNTPVMATVTTAFSTATPTNTPSATETPRPSGTPTLQSTPTGTPSSSPTPTLTLTSWPVPTIDPTLAFFQGASTGSNVEGLGTARLLIINQSGVARIEVIIKGVTLKREQPAYYEATVMRSAVIEILWGSYQILVQVPGKGSLTAAFVQRGKDKTTLTVEKNKLTILGP